MNDIKILKIGTFVKFGEHNEIKGEIIAVTIRETFLIYEISYWKNDEQKTIWLKEKDFKVTKPEKKTIGFIDNDNKETP